MGKSIPHPPQGSSVAQVRLDGVHLEPAAHLLVRSRCRVGWKLRRTAELCSLPPFQMGQGPVAQDTCL
eukprot:904344-Pyramimonas_sp.AAC.1